MPSFPALKCGAVAQYPADRIRRFGTRVLRFLDGSEQRFPQQGAELKRWVVRLSLLDEGELAAVEEFFMQQAGAAGVFSFTDPWDTTEYLNCSFAHDEVSGEHDGIRRGRVDLIIKENR